MIFYLGERDGLRGCGELVDRADRGKGLCRCVLLVMSMMVNDNMNGYVWHVVCRSGRCVGGGLLWVLWT